MTFLTTFLAACLLFLALPARADLMLYPTRIVLNEDKRAAQIDLINNGSERATYRITLVNRRMSESGEIVAIDAPLPDERFADRMLRYSPRQVTLDPGAAQTIRVMADPPAPLADGEYRSHLQIDRLPMPSGQSSIEQARSAGEKQIGIQLRALVGASIPVIVRSGATQATAAIAGLALRTHEASGLPLLSMELHRQGNQSVYGDLSIFFKPQSGAPVPVGQAGGIAVYTPNLLRRASLLLEPPAQTSLSKGTLTVSYRERAEDGGRLLAEAQLVLP